MWCSAREYRVSLGSKYDVNRHTCHKNTQCPNAHVQTHRANYCQEFENTRRDDNVPSLEYQLHVHTYES